jgi:hypothetical protein
VTKYETVLALVNIGLIGPISWFILWNKSRKQEVEKMAIEIQECRDKIAHLDKHKMEEEDMRVYVELMVKPLVEQLGYVREESIRTRQLLEKIYDRDNSK